MASSTLTFVDRDEIAALNAEHLGHDGPTDVLSFPLDPMSRSAGTDVPVLLGDVVVCPGVAADQAGGHAGTLDDELALLVVHGVLHVLGHDHAEAAEAGGDARARARALERHHWHGPPPAGFRQEHSRRERDRHLRILIAIIVLLLVLVVLAAAETSLNRISLVKAQALAEATGTRKRPGPVAAWSSHPERFINPLLVTVTCCRPGRRS